MQSEYLKKLLGGMSGCWTDIGKLHALYWLIGRQIASYSEKGGASEAAQEAAASAAAPPETKKDHSSIRVRNAGPIFVAAHVGTGYCRAALVCVKGSVLHLVSTPCKVYESGPFAETSSDEVWIKLVKCIRKLSESIERGQVRGIGFTAVAGLVCLDPSGKPVTASASRDPKINVILHHDHRSILEAKRINDTRHALLRYFGERVLPEFAESRLMWLKSNLKEDCWDKAGHFFELSDFLTWKATGSLIRSSSCLVSQWSYEIAANATEGWNAGFFKELNMEELAEDDFKKIGSSVQRPGTPVADGLLEDVALEMGLPAKLPVATSVTDAFAGSLGLIGCNFKGIADDVTNRLCLVFGTGSASHFALSPEPHFMKGVKGPFRDGLLPNMWLNQADQTTAESALEFIIDMHPASNQIRKQIPHMHIHKYLNKILRIKAQKTEHKMRSFLTRHLHVLPDFQGNISPMGDPWMRGMISGISATTSQESLALLYLAVMQSLAYSTKHIISTLTQQGHDIRCIVLGGILGRNSLFLQLHKDVSRLPVVSPSEPQSQLVGAAVLAGVAANVFGDFKRATEQMCGKGDISMPDTDERLIEYHEQKYRVFLKMYDHQMEYRRIMKEAKVQRRTSNNVEDESS